MNSFDDAQSRAVKGDSGKDQAIGGSIFAGVRLVFSSSYLIGICFLILLYTTLATFLYFQQAQIVRDSFDDPANRTALFAVMDFSVNFLTIITQLLVTSRIVRKWGLGLCRFESRRTEPGIYRIGCSSPGRDLGLDII